MTMLQIIKNKLVSGQCLNCQSTKYNCDGFSVYTHTSAHQDIERSDTVRKFLESFVPMPESSA